MDRRWYKYQDEDGNETPYKKMLNAAKDSYPILNPEVVVEGYLQEIRGEKPYDQVDKEKLEDTIEYINTKGRASDARANARRNNFIRSILERYGWAPMAEWDKERGWHKGN